MRTWFTDSCSMEDQHEQVALIVKMKEQSRIAISEAHVRYWSATKTQPTVFRRQTTMCVLKICPRSRMSWQHEFSWSGTDVNLEVSLDHKEVRRKAVAETTFRCGLDSDK